MSMGKRSTVVVGSNKIIKEIKQSPLGLVSNYGEKQYPIGNQAIVSARMFSTGCQVGEIEIQ